MILATIIVVFSNCSSELPDYPYEVIDTIPVGNKPNGMAVAPNGEYVYVENGSGVKSQHSTFVSQARPIVRF